MSNENEQLNKRIESLEQKIENQDTKYEKTLETMTRLAVSTENIASKVDTLISNHEKSRTEMLDEQKVLKERVRLVERQNDQDSTMRQISKWVGAAVVTGLTVAVLTLITK